MQTTPTVLSGPTRNPFTDYYPWSYDPIRRQPASLRQHQDSARSASLDTRIMNGSSFFDVINSDHQSSSAQSQYYQSPIEEEEQSSDLHQSASASSSSSSNSQPPVLSSSPAAQFLSAFSSPPKTHAALPDDEGQAVGGYTLGSVVGYGAFSTIRRAYSASGGVVAVKIVRGHDISKLPNAAQTKKRLDREVAAWSSLSHEHILPLFSAVHSSYADYFFTLYCPAGSLFDILKRDGRPALPHDDAGTMFRQVVRGLRYMHEVAGYVHRDMKLENVLVDEMGICRIGDFGMSCKIGDLDEECEDDDDDELEWQSPTPHSGVHRAASMAVPASKRHGTSLSVTRHGSVRCRNTAPSRNHRLSNPGSLPYAAPELLLPRTTPLPPHPSQDIWAIGVMLYALLIGRLPFSDSYEPRLQVKITSGVYDIPSDIGRGAGQVLKGCLERNVRARWTITMVDDVAWGIGWKTEQEDDDEPLPQSRSDLFDPDRALPKKTSKHAATQRSDSRRRHSSSRSPASGDPPGSKGERRRSRTSSPVLGSLETTVLSNDSLSGSSSFSPASEPALLLSPSSSLERGRKPIKLGVYYPSRSPSPSVVPRTPVDGAPRFRSTLTEENKSETAPRRHAAVHSLHHHPHFVPDDAPIPETGVLDWTAEGRPFVSFFDDESPSRSRVERSVSLGWRVDGKMGDSSLERRAVSRSKKRAESTPPRSVSVALPLWTTLESRGRMTGVSPSTAEDHRFLKPLGTAPIMSVSKKPAPLPRSKSAGHARYEHDLYALRPRMTLNRIRS